MSALTKARTSRVRKAGGMDFPVAAGVKIQTGAACVLSGGYLEPGTTGTGLLFVGKATATVDNTSGGNGAVTCHVQFMREKTLFPWVGDAVHTFSQTDVGSDAYILDDQTATPASQSSGKSVAGNILAVDVLAGGTLVWTEV